MVYDMILYSKLDFKKRGLCGNSQRRLVTKMLVLGLATVALFLIRMSIMDFKGPKFRAMENPVAFADTQQTKVGNLSMHIYISFSLLRSLFLFHATLF